MICSECHEELGTNGKCVSCKAEKRRIKDRERYNNNKEKILERNRQSYERNKDKRREYANNRAKNPEVKKQKAEYNRQYISIPENRLKSIERSREWRKAGNKTVRPADYNEKIAAKAKEKYNTDEEYREQRKQSTKLYKKNNPDKVKEAQKKWVEENKEYVQEYHREYQYNLRKEGKAYKKTKEARQREATIRNGRKYEAEGEITNEYLHWLHIWQDNCCVYCNTPMGNDSTVDHVVALNKGGTNNPYNIVLVCIPCNTSKQDKLLTEWRPRNILPVEKYHSIWAIREAEKEFINNNIKYEKKETYFIFPNGKKLFLLSSFWMSSRIGQLPKYSLNKLIALFPESVFIFDYEWKKRKDAILNSLLVKSNQSESLFARNLDFVKLNTTSAKDLMEDYHLQGFGAGRYYYGLRQKDGELVAAVSVSVSKEGSYLINRIAFKKHIVGGISKLVSNIVKDLPENSQIYSFADTRLGVGDGYIKSGFMLQGTTVPTVKYVNGEDIYHWKRFMKVQLPEKTDFYDAKMNSWELLMNNGIWTIDDVPLLRFVYSPDNK